uniref:Phospholipase A2 n=1 Tax=Varanus komodoensis TaxID=61221 RepID=A0A8D2KX78_VARKO
MLLTTAPHWKGSIWPSIKILYCSMLCPTVSETDCYVTLWLPTASSEKVRTKTVRNCKDPVWNEMFYFRIQSQVKNVLELAVCDEDVIRDDDYCIILFDIAKVPLGETIFMKFELNPHVKQHVKCTLKGSFEETQNTLLACTSRLHFTEPAVFHFAKHNQGVLDILLPRKRPLVSLVCHRFLRCKPYIHLYSTSGPDIRLGFDLCPEEKEFLQKRKKVVAAALKRVLQLEEDLQDDEVPVVAIMTTGGGMRALTALYAHLLIMQKLDVLDCVSYFSGLSGTTWTMSNLYNDPNWSHKDLEVPLLDAKKHMNKNKFFASFAPERLKYYVKELRQRSQEGHIISFTDLWGLIIEAMLHDGEVHQKLTDQKQALNHGQNPLPVYLCLNVKEKVNSRGFREWLEFTPYEVGFQKYGAYIRAEHFGSEFFMGHLMKKIPESRISFLEGIWSSVFSVNLMDAWFQAVSEEDFWQIWTRDRVTDIDEYFHYMQAYKLPTRMQSPPDSLANVFQDIITWRPAVSVVPNFLKGCPMHNKYLESEFSNWKDCDLDSFPNQLTGAEDFLYLIDNAFALQSSYPPLMRPERNVDLIIHLNYSTGSQLEALIEASEYFSEQGIPFPKNVPSKEEEKELKECYLIGEQEGAEIPLVLLFPLVASSFREYKAPGIKRSPEETADGIIDMTSVFSPYDINTLRYSEEDFEKLVKLSQYNIENNKDMIINALRIAVERKRQTEKRLKSWCN